MAASSAMMEMPSATSLTSFLPSEEATGSKVSAVSRTLFESEQELILDLSARSSARAICTRFAMSPLIRSTWRMVEAVHSFSPSIISRTSVLARMTARGVFSSWLALVMNCFCRSIARSSGRITE